MVIRRRREEAGWEEKKYMGELEGPEQRGSPIPYPRVGGCATYLTVEGGDYPSTTWTHASYYVSSLWRHRWNCCRRPSSYTSYYSSTQWRRLRCIFHQLGWSYYWDWRVTLTEGDYPMSMHPTSPQRWPLCRQPIFVISFSSLIFLECLVSTLSLANFTPKPLPLTSLLSLISSCLCLLLLSFFTHFLYSLPPNTDPIQTHRRTPLY